MPPENTGASLQPGGLSAFSAAGRLRLPHPPLRITSSRGARWPPARTRLRWPRRRSESFHGLCSGFAWAELLPSGSGARTLAHHQPGRRHPPLLGPLSQTGFQGSRRRPAAVARHWGWCGLVWFVSLGGSSLVGAKRSSSSEPGSSWRTRPSLYSPAGDAGPVVCRVCRPAGGGGED